MADDKQTDQNHDDKPMSFLTLVILTGLIGGILWSGIGYFTHFINLTEIHPKVILDPWTIGDWKDSWLGTVISLLIIGAISIVAALIYYALLRKFLNIWVGIFYGIFLFLLVFFVLNPIFPGINPYNELERNTIITSICLYVLYGVFVGYTISYEEGEVKYKEKREKEAKS
ncbi:YqhR family membrane protein [Bacillus sp. DTU_2020_1000418_1_SI_GHA_SEK_038]|uniref:YqhR family membrane protein n=1 Tax=Bacillus sp. DTU_2020_1000418_1_SI_GHA_SEK_038 TaxID=3077585 RepID=UPI0028E81397|nr:YqhR family membrane protein [Bacillus sp. DTU_2020_1000418_1_SI_GHA_SEK_038]WNS74193.1 YqhR family membrane protein [Bacillus sp. DTU_2020_1000418_1_SI_GHA_SEK_038]